MASPMPTLTLIPTDGGIHVLAEIAGRCGGCGTASFIFINRNGRTHCVHCDKALKKVDSPK